MDWVQFVLFFSGMAGMFFWLRSEARSDIRHMDSNMKHIDQKIDNLINAIQAETKEFHGRLCGLEAKGK